MLGQSPICIKANLANKLSEQSPLRLGRLSATGRVKLRALTFFDEEHARKRRALVGKVPPRITFSGDLQNLAATEILSNDCTQQRTDITIQ